MDRARRHELGSLDEHGHPAASRRMGFVFQAFHLLPHLTVAANVALPLALNGIAGREASARVGMLAAVGLGDRASSWPRELSGGELQRVAVARALVHRPALVLADEPTGNLDPDNAAAILEVLRAQIKRDRAAGILVTHSRRRPQTTDRVYELTRTGLHRAMTDRHSRRIRGDHEYDEDVRHDHGSAVPMTVRARCACSMTPRSARCGTRPAARCWRSSRSRSVSRSASRST